MCNRQLNNLLFHTRSTRKNKHIPNTNPISREGCQRVGSRYFVQLKPPYRCYFDHPSHISSPLSPERLQFSCLCAGHFSDENMNWPPIHEILNTPLTDGVKMTPAWYFPVSGVEQKDGLVSTFCIQNSLQIKELSIVSLSCHV